TLQAEIETSAVAAEWPTGPATSTPTPVAPIAGPIAPVSPADVAGGPASAAGTPAYGQVHSHPARVDPATPAAPDDGPPAAAPGDGSPAAAPGNGPPAVEPGNGPPVAAPVNGVPAAAPGNGPPVGARLPVPMPHDRLFEGRVLVDAGPFVDIAGVAAFQRALELVPGASAVDVTALELDRAHLELELSDPVALGREIRAVFPFNFAIFEAGHGRLSINVDASSQTARQAALGTR
ncbi:MAG TPA: hypothetical protein VG165_03475, partial [Solirubrobacteraceae bacterium]|nr:hypothetical protein [Solirubrobacteraceae bacterium]